MTFPIDMNQFDNETRLVAGEGGFTGLVHPDWNIGNNPNGGYLLALAVTALRQQAPHHPDPLSITVHYLRPGLANQPCRIDASTLRSGRTLSTARATLLAWKYWRPSVIWAMAVNRRLRWRRRSFRRPINAYRGRAMRKALTCRC